MYISTETQEQTDDRLKKVIQAADLKIYDYYFNEVPINKFHLKNNFSNG